jgi:predicted nucleic acid-binding protein
VPSLVITEVSYLLATRLGTQAEVRLLADFAGGHFHAEPVATGDWMRIAQLVWRYQNLPLDTADASVVAAAERLGIATLATLDRRHLALVRPEHVDAFTILPECLS